MNRRLRHIASKLKLLFVRCRLQSGGFYIVIISCVFASQKRHFGKGRKDGEVCVVEEPKAVVTWDELISAKNLRPPRQWELFFVRWVRRLLSLLLNITLKGKLKGCFTNKLHFKAQDYIALTISRKNYGIKKKILHKLSLKNCGRNALQATTTAQYNSYIWLTEQSKPLTASYFGRICKMKSLNVRAKSVIFIIYNSFQRTKATKMIALWKRGVKVARAGVWERRYCSSNCDHCHPSGCLDRETGSTNLISGRWASDCIILEKHSRPTLKMLLTIVSVHNELFNSVHHMRACMYGPGLMLDTPLSRMTLQGSSLRQSTMMVDE
ncbi:hypothetical protein PR048_027756 [Dryococelus australis]|uniref:Uncharacterized protein n=1 Tax=Dryococelus australis TaxID=614101 RepID=A0ABQ9GHE1_9NEOP|nr:hypothetical protein PR048_027756 [Dryococelus australis]